jgi:hypothetical protein
MGDLVEFKLEDGSSVVVETESVSSRAVMRGGRLTETLTTADKTLEQAFDRLRPATAAIIERVRSMAQQPEEIEIEFGVTVNAEVGAVIAKTSGEANFRIALRWTRPPDRGV